MKKSTTHFIFLYLWTLLLIPSNTRAQKIQYELSCPNAVHHEAEISLVVTDITTSQPAIFRMSRSSPGRYATHEFGKNVYNVKAFDKSNKPLKINRIDGDVYEVPSHSGYVKMAYTLYGNYADGTYMGIDITNLHLNMPATFMWIKGYDNRPIEIKFNIPKDKKWKIATQLKPTQDPSVFTASGLQYFMDSPTKIGNLKIKEWPVSNPDGQKYTIRLAIETKATDKEINEFAEKLKRIVAEEQAIYGELPNYDYGTYTFIASVNPYVKSDGMEHRNSTMITATTNTLVTEEWLLDGFAHEFFHCWNVERIRPQTLEPFNFEKSNMSNELWFAEGFTQYYGQLIMVRSGIAKELDYAQTIDRAVYVKNNTQGAIAYSPVDASNHAVFVDAGAAVDKNNYANMFTSYYSYGAAVAMALDLELRNRFASSLDVYMQEVWKRYGKTEIAYKIENLKETLAILTKDTQFAQSFFDKYIYSFEAIDYASLLAPAGFAIRKDKEGKAWMGGRFVAANEGVQISENTTVGSPIYAAGLDIEDVILQIDKKSIKKPEDIGAIVESHKIGDTISIAYKHNGNEETTTVKLIENPYLTVEPFEKVGKPVTDAIRNYRKNWLGSKLK